MILKLVKSQEDNTFVKKEEVLMTPTSHLENINTYKRKLVLHGGNLGFTCLEAIERCLIEREKRNKKRGEKHFCPAEMAKSKAWCFHAHNPYVFYAQELFYQDVNPFLGMAIILKNAPITLSECEEGFFLWALLEKEREIVKIPGLTLDTQGEHTTFNEDQIMSFVTQLDHSARIKIQHELTKIPIQPKTWEAECGTKALNCLRK